jgi:hypothetical protein
VLHNFGGVPHGYSPQSMSSLVGSTPSYTDTIFRSCGGICGRLSLRHRLPKRVGWSIDRAPVDIVTIAYDPVAHPMREIASLSSVVASHEPVRATVAIRGGESPWTPTRRILFNMANYTAYISAVKGSGPARPAPADPVMPPPITGGIDMG